MTNDEWLWTVDADDVPTGKVLRSEAYRDGRSDFRVINAFLRRKDGRIWIPKRGPGKRIFPNALDMSVGGHVEHGEDYLFAFFRETGEELNLDLSEVEWRTLGKLSPHTHGVSAFMTLYLIESEDTPRYNPDDFQSAEWLLPEEALALIESGTPAKGDLPILLRHLISSGV